MQSSVRTLLGEQEAVTLGGGNLKEQLARLGSLNPLLSRSILEEGLGQVTAQATTDYREWCLQVLAVLSAMGDAADQSQVYLQAALRHGATAEEVQDVLNLTYLYAGAPRAVTAARRMDRFLADAEAAGGGTKYEVALPDHRTMVWDSRGQGDAAKAVPILLIHALDMDHRFWRAVFPALAAKARVIAYDIRGHGHARGAPLTVSLDQLGGDIAALLDLLEVPLADVYGASYGGAIAQQFALTHPERVRAMGLIATVIKAPAEELAGRSYDAEQQGMEVQVAKSLIRWFLPETIARNDWMVRYARRCVRGARVAEWAAAWRAMATLDARDRAGELDIPVLVLSGKQDLSATPDMMAEIPGFYRQSRLVSIDPGTHMAAMEQPDAVARALTQFRDEVDRTFRLKTLQE